MLSSSKGQLPRCSQSTSTNEFRYVLATPYNRHDLQRIRTGFVEDEVVPHRPEQNGSGFCQILALVARAKFAGYKPECLYHFNKYLAGNSMPGLFQIVVFNGN